jgi:hypothetical protein
MTEPDVLTVEETAEKLRLGRTAAYEAVRRGDIPSIPGIRAKRIPRRWVDQVLNPTGNGDAPADNGRAGKVRDDSAQPPD